MLQVTWLLSVHQSVLFQHSYAQICLWHRLQTVVALFIEGLDAATTTWQSCLWPLLKVFSLNIFILICLSRSLAALLQHETAVYHSVKIQKVQFKGKTNSANFLSKMGDSHPVFCVYFRSFTKKRYNFYNKLKCKSLSSVWCWVLKPLD